MGVEQEVSKTLGFVTEIELFYGQVAGEFDHVGAQFRPDAREHLPGWDLKNAELRQLWLHWKSPWFLLRAGQMGSHWGFGLLANDGRPTPGRLGLQDQGDLSDRVLLATRPLARVFPDAWAGKLVAALGGGLVYRDENSSLRNGDVAGEALLSIFYPGDELWAGLYVAGRFAKDFGGTDLDVLALDFHAKWEPEEEQSGPLAGAEMVYVVGATNRLITATAPDGVGISAFGAIARLGWVMETWNIRPLVEVGFASGDTNPHDDTVSSFSFDPDYKVGLVLFDTVIRSLSAMDAQQSADPQRVGIAISGTDQLATGGKVSNTFYVYPQISLCPIKPLTLMLAVLYARSVTEFSQVYQTFDHGGVPTNAYGKVSPGRELGWELDMGIDWAQALWNDLQLNAGVQAGWFMPGSAFDNADGSRPGIMARLLARIVLNW